MKPYELRDPIHSRITFDDFERTVIDHPFFQRLRFISQLSFLQAYVYPGAVHDRFSHCLGAMHIAGRLFGQFIQSSDTIGSRLSDEEITKLQRRVRLAGLLHDIGHGPFSHSSEVVFPLLRDLPLRWDWWVTPRPPSGSPPRPPSPPDRTATSVVRAGNSPLGKGGGSRQAKHEDYSVLLIGTLAKEGLIDESMAQDVCSLIHAEIKPSSWFASLESRAPTLQKILKALISGEVDCDRMDYLLRDSYYCGVAYGHYDLDWLISSMAVGEKDGRLIFTISENGVRAFEDLLLARYHMIDQVYFHKTKVGFIHYLEEAIKSREINLNIPTDPYEYADMRDGKVIEMFISAAKNQSNYWSHHLMSRLPARRVLRLHESNLEDIAMLDKLTALCRSNNIRFFTHSVKNALSHFGEGSDVASMIYVAKKALIGIDFVPILEYSDLLQKYNEKLHFTDFFVLREDFDEFQKIVSALK